MDWFDDDLTDLRERGLHRVRRRVQSAQGVHVFFQGRDFLNFAANDYLNLAGDPRLARAAARAARRYGTGAGASALVAGYLPPHRALERALARWEGTEAALVFSSGFVANLAVVGSLAGEGDAVFSDELNHASLLDGCRLSRARVCVYRHADVEHLEALLHEEKSARRRLIVTDSVFSMDGDVAPLADIAELARQHDCLLVVDEAHATGVLGKQGQGLSTPSERLVKIGTLSKALGAQGGFVCGAKSLIDWLVNRARPYIFSTALAPPSAAAARCAVALAQEQPERRLHLQVLAESLRTELRAAGFPKSASRTHIVPVIVGDARAAVALSARLEENGLLVPAIRPPSVPEGSARLRISVTAGHTEADVARLVAALREAQHS